MFLHLRLLQLLIFSNLIYNSCCFFLTFLSVLIALLLAHIKNSFCHLVLYVAFFKSHSSLILYKYQYHFPFLSQLNMLHFCSYIYLLSQGHYLFLQLQYSSDFCFDYFLIMSFYCACYMFGMQLSFILLLLINLLSLLFFTKMFINYLQKLLKQIHFFAVYIF